jgi:hypothetical protein
MDRAAPNRKSFYTPVSPMQTTQYTTWCQGEINTPRSKFEKYCA